MDLKLAALEKLHLTETESRVYLAILELGQGTIQDITKKSGVIRSSVYNQVSGLKGRRLIQEIRKGKRNIFSAASPEQILEQERARLHEFERAIPQLLAIFNTAAKPRVMFYEGIEGIKKVYADVIRAKLPYDGVSDFENSIKVLGNFYRETYIPQRIRHQILTRFIVRDSLAARAWAKNNNRDLRETKFIPYSDLSVEVGVYGSAVLIMNFRSNPPLVVKIEDAAIAGTVHVMWQQLWDRLPE